jgi:hypothetical protein
MREFKPPKKVQVVALQSPKKRVARPQKKATAKKQQSKSQVLLQRPSDDIIWSIIDSRRQRL